MAGRLRNLLSPTPAVAASTTANVRPTNAADGLQTIAEASTEQTDFEEASVSVESEPEVANAGVENPGKEEVTPAISRVLSVEALQEHLAGIPEAAPSYTSCDNDAVSLKLEAAVPGQPEGSIGYRSPQQKRRSRGVSMGSSIDSLLGDEGRTMRSVVVERLDGSFASLKEAIGSMSEMHASFTRMDQSIYSNDGTTSLASKASRFSALSGLNPRLGGGKTSQPIDQGKGISTTLSTLIVINYLSGGLLLPGGKSTSS